MDLTNLSTNWKNLQKTLTQRSKPAASDSPSRQHGVKRKRGSARDEGAKISARTSTSRKKPRTRTAMNHAGSELARRVSVREPQNSTTDPHPPPPIRGISSLVNAGRSNSVELGKYVALDCEMVGVGPDPDRESALARVSIVNFNGDQVYDSYVLPLEPVTDWRTHVSGITAQHMKDARGLKEVQTVVANVLKDRVLVGHALRHDLAALMLSHPQQDIRDTARHPPYRKQAGGVSPRLKMLASELLGLEIQEGEHSSVEDARACMLLFRKDKAAFEREHLKKWPTRPPPAEPQTAVDEDDDKPRKQKKKKKKKKKH